MAIGFQFVDDNRIVFGVHNDRDALPVLGSTSDHGGTADVNVLDGVLHRHVRFCNRLAERIEVDAHKVDGSDPVLFKLAHVVRKVTTGQKGSVNLRMEGLDPAVTDFREAGHVAYAGDGQSCLFQHLHRPAGGKQLPTQRHKFAGEFNHARLVANTD